MEGPPRKVPFIGDAGVGKTSLITRFMTDRFPNAPVPTVGVMTVQVQLSHESNQIAVNLWDTAGQERFRSLVPLCARGSDLIVLVFSVAAEDPFADFNQWITKIRNDLQLMCPIVICGNKSDLPWRTDHANATQWAREMNCKIVFTSAKTGENVQELFQSIAELLVMSVKEAVRAQNIALAPVTQDGSFRCCRSG
jgi:small GTP-binding protein